MSFFNFGPSPTKSSGNGQQSSNNDFNMFGVGTSGSLFGGQEEGTSGGSIFGGPEESGVSMFGSAGFDTPMKQEPDSGSGQGDIVTPPMKKQRPEVSNSRTNQTSDVNMSDIYKLTANPTKHHSTQESFNKRAAVDTHVHVHGAPSGSVPSMIPELPQNHRDDPEQAKASTVFHNPTSAPTKVQDKPSSVQSSVLKEEVLPKTLVPKKEDGDFKPADQIFKDLLNRQRQQLSELLPELKATDERSEQVLDNAMLVMKEVDNYSEKLAGIKQQYCSRLSQVSSFLKMIPKHEK